MSSLVKSVRLAAVALPVLLVTSTLQAAPAAADPGDRPDTARFWLTSVAKYPYPEVPGSDGVSPQEPADARAAPGLLSLSVQVVNDGDEPLRDITVGVRVVKNGQVDSIECSATELFADDVILPYTEPPGPQDEDRRAVPGRSPSASAQRAAQAGASSKTWNEPDFVLPVEKSLYCAVRISGITDTVLHEDVASATAVGAESGMPATDPDVHRWAGAGKLRPPAPGPVRVTGSSFLDRDNSYGRDIYPDEPDKTEPVVPGLHMTITGPDGKAPTNYRTGHGVVGPQTGDSEGNIVFDDLRPYTHYYDVTLDMTSPALKGMAKPLDGPGRLSLDRSTWTQHVSTSSYDAFANWRVVPAHLLYLTMVAPRSAIAGSRMTITGQAERADIGAWDGPVVLEQNPPGGDWDDWTKVADVTDEKGKLSVSVTANQSTGFRFRHVGNDDASEAVSLVYRVAVFTAPVILTASAPATVEQGSPLTVTGTIKRAGKPFSSGRIVLEHTLDNKTWTTVADGVRSSAGVMSATVQASRTGSYRWRYLGDSKTSPGTSRNRHVVVSPAPTSRSSPSASPSASPSRSASPSASPSPSPSRSASPSSSVSASTR